MRYLSIFAVLLICWTPSLAPAATPPDKVTFQGLLADPVGDPLHGFFEVVAELYDAEAGGNQILVEEHLASGSGAVAVDYGRLALQLGTGDISDGTGPGNYTTLTAVFADHDGVWIALTIEGETLSPRIAVASTPQALNSTLLAGRADSEFLDLSPTPQAKIGRLSATTLAIDGQNLEFAGGATVSSTGVGTQITAGTGGSEDLVLAAGAGPGDGGISIQGGGGVDLTAGNGTFTFSDGVTDAVMATLGPGLFTLGGEIEIQGGDPAPGKVLTSDAFGRATWTHPSTAPSDELTALAELVGFPAGDLPPYAALYDDHCALGASTATLTIDGSGAGTVLGWIGRDGISMVYEYRVAFATGAAVDPDSLIGLEAVIQLDRAIPAGPSTNFYRGWITEAAEAGSSGGDRLYTIAFSPQLAGLDSRVQSRSFENIRVSEISVEVLTEHGITPDIDATSQIFDSIIQWSESDLRFLTRLWERDGIHFHHVQDGAGVVPHISWSNSVFPTLATPLGYFGDQVNPGTGEDFVSIFRTPRRSFIGDTEVRTLDPSVLPHSEPIVATASLAGGLGSEVEYQADIADQEHANLRASIMGQRNRVEESRHWGSGAASGLHGGSIFTLNDSANGDLSGSYLVTEVTNFARVAGACVEIGSGFGAIPSGYRYRPPQVTPRPVARGPMTASVIGLNDEPDSAQRVEVAFHIEDGGVARAWIPVVTPPGKSRHDVFYPEIDDMVVVDFIGNDPFRPYLAGSFVDWEDWAIDPRPLDPIDPWFTAGIGTMVDGHLYMWSRRENTDPTTAGRFQSIFFRDTTGYDAAWLRFLDSDQTAGEPRFELSHDLKLMQALTFEDSPDAGILGNFRVDGSVEFSHGSQIHGVGDLSISSGGTLDLSSVIGSWTASGLLDLDAATFDIDGVSLFIDMGAAVAFDSPTINLSNSGGPSAINAPFGLTIGSAVDISLDSPVGSWDAGGLLDLDATVLDLDGGSFQLDTTGATNITAGGSISLNGGAEIVNSATTLTFESDTETRVMIDSLNDSTEDKAAWYHDGAYDGTGLLATLDEDGDFQIKGMFISGPVKNAAQTLPAGGAIEPGWLVGLDPSHPGEVRPTSTAGDPMVLGAVSATPGMLFGGTPSSLAELESNWGAEMAREYLAARPRLLREILESETKELSLTPEQIRTDDGVIERLALEAFHDERLAAIAVAGQVEVAADASQGPISIGDALSPGPLPGHAIPAREGWPVVGIALENLTDGRGLIKMLVSRSVAAANGAPATTPPPAEKSAWNPPLDNGSPTNGGTLSLPLVMRHPDNPSSEVLSMGADGSVSTRAAITTGRSGLAELLPVSELVTAGDVVVVDLDQPGRYRRGDSMSDPTVVGVVIDRPGLEIGNNLEAVLAAEPRLAAELAEAEDLGQEERRNELLALLEAIADESLVPVATGGTVVCHVDASYGSISPGDLLMTSPTPGHAQRADAATPGTILGKALEPFDTGTGTIRILVMLR